jgi:iron complex outermembrane receptor protein
MVAARIAAVAAALAWLAGATPEATAQEQQTEPRAQQRRTSGIEAITVTAQRREQLLQETPVAVTAFSGADLTTLSIEGSQDIAAFTPGLVVSKASNSQGLMALFGRGVGAADNHPMVDSKVGFYIDGAYQGVGNGASFDLMDIERVEVLRGPQGTLYGRNTIAGAINVIPKKPTSEFGFKLKGSVGDFNRRELTGVVNFPIVAEKVMARLSFTRGLRDGFYSNDWEPGDEEIDDKDVKGFRSALRLIPLENFTADYTFEWIERDEHSPLFVLRTSCASLCRTPGGPLFNVNTSTLIGFTPLPGVPPFATFQTNDNDDISVDGNRFARVKTWNHALNLSWNLTDNLTLKSVSGWRRGVFGGENDLDGSPYNLFHSGQHETFRNYLQEFILDGTAFEDRLDFVVGTNWYEAEHRGRNFSDQFISCPACTGFFPVSQSATTLYDGYAWATFGQATLHATDRLSLTGGVRWTKERKEASYELCTNDRTRTTFSLSGRDIDTCFAAFSFPFNVPRLVRSAHRAVPGISAVTGESARFDGWSPMARVQYEWSDTQMTYLTWARGYQAGGFPNRAGGNTLAQIVATTSPFKEESLFSWELGYKSRWFDDRLQLNVAGYYNQFKDQQITTFLPGAGTTTIIENAGKSRIRGIEFEALASPFDGLTVMLTHAFTNFDYSEFIGADPTRDPTGVMKFNLAKEASETTRHRAHLPKRKWSGLVQYAFPEMGVGQLTVSGNFLRESAKWWLETRRQDFKTKSSSYTIYGARIELREAFGVEGLSLAVVGENLTDRTYMCCQGIDFAFFQGQGYGYPRQVWFEMGYEFGGI